MKRLFIFCIIGLSLQTIGAASFFNIKDYGALGDGKTIDSPAINQAIEAAAATGGGTIYFPPGTYLSYSIRLQSNITLWLDNGCTLLAAYPEKTSGYDVAEANEFSQYQDFGHSHWKNSLIWGMDLDNITICGSGQIDGKGLSREESRLPGVGNKAISLKLCRNVTIKDITMVHCGHFALLATGVDNLTLHNVKVDTNRDGFDIDCCRNVRISDCSVNSPWDDAIVLKSSYGLGFFRDTENVTISNCFVSGFDQGSMIDGTFTTDDLQAPDHAYNTGRIKFGTESSGGFKNISITNCIFEHCRGLALETVDGGSLEDVVINNITMRDIVNSPIFLRLGARMRSPEGTPVGTMARIRISNVNVYNVDSQYACIISGIPGHCIEDVSLTNIHIVFKGGGTKEDALLLPPENEKIYPEPLMFGTIPASGFFIRHARNIELNQIHIDFLDRDFRPSLWLEDVQDLSLYNYQAKVEDGVKFAIRKEVENFKME
ncbi:MAG: glycoside hydrolase family 28 protein [Tannerella sp.]|jgi:polygalacturonase|nr:glycoside hydrolase family 28 protein [Tannerella sp.]